MGRPAARSRPPAGGHYRQGRQVHHYPHRRHRPGRPRLPGRRHRAATQHPRTRDLTSRPRNVVLTTGPAGVTSCHKTIFFTPLFKLGLSGEDGRIDYDRLALRSAETIFPSRPTTAEDYRKALLDAV